MPHHKTHIYFVITFLMIGLIIACNMPGADPTPDLSLVVAQTQTSVALDQMLTATTASQENLLETPISSPTQPTLNPTEKTFLTPTATEITAIPDCIDKAKFLSETVTDGSIYAPGETFVKTWRLMNDGNCVWTPDYALVFVNGEQLDGVSPTPIGSTVQPGGELVVDLQLSAPQDGGEYQGFWKLRNPRGTDFGLGKNADVSFWVKIAVNENGVDNGGMDLGEPDWIETFDGGSSIFPLGAGDDTNYEIKDNNLQITVFKSGGDLWRVSSKNLLNFALEARFVTGDKCNGKDSFGLIIRAPSQEDNIIDSGYIFGFACDGSYRIYLMSNGSFTGIVSWTKHPSIKAGPNNSNKLGIKASGKEFQLFANGDLLFTFTDSTYPSGLLGSMIRSDGTQNFQIQIEQLSYWQFP